MKIEPEFEAVLSGLPEFVFNSDTLALSSELMPVAGATIKGHRAD
jgi:hypothetical protein